MKGIVGLVLVATALGTAGAVSGSASQGPSEPHVLRWERNGQPGTGIAVGLLYTPDVLTALTSRMPAGAIPVAISKAIQQRTAVVALWEIPPSYDYQHQRPYHVLVVENDNPNAGAPSAIQPLWIQQGAGDLGGVDRRLTSLDMRVGVIAAFPASAFVPHRLVLVHSTPELHETGRMRSAQRWGVIRWDGAVQPPARQRR